MTATRRLRLLALATQHFGVNATTAKAALEDADFGMREDLSDTTLAQALAMYANLRDGRLA